MAHKHKITDRLARLIASLFYRVQRTGPPIPGGAVLLVANHPNALLDPALVQTTAGRPVRFLAKSTLFRGHVLGPIIRLSGAIPVYRRIDAGVDPARNVDAFAAVEAVLGRGEVVCVFPEGISHSTGRLEPLRTGAARMALASLARGTRVTLMPIGLHFHRLVSFRSRATVAYGVPFDCVDLAAAYREGRWCADAGRPTRFKPSSPSPTDAVRDGSAKLGHPVQNVTREHGLTPLPR